MQPGDEAWMTLEASGWRARALKAEAALASSPPAQQAGVEDALREALEPFARLAESLDVAVKEYLGIPANGLLPETTLPVGGNAINKKVTITIGAILAARAALRASTDAAAQTTLNKDNPNE